MVEVLAVCSVHCLQGVLEDFCTPQSLRYLLPHFLLLLLRLAPGALTGDIDMVVEREQGKDNCVPLTSCFTLFAAPPCTAHTKDRRPGATGERNP